MHIVKARIENYKSFLDSGDIKLGRGFNFVVGRNDAGKSAFLEALSLVMVAKPHRSLKNLPRATSVPKPQSVVSLEFSMLSEDVHACLSQHASYLVYVEMGADSRSAAQMLNQACSAPLTLATTWTDANLSTKGIVGGNFASGPSQVAVRNSSSPAGLSFDVSADGGGQQDLTAVLAYDARQRIYGFKAERIGTRPHAARGLNTLATDSSNLAEVLNTLSAGNPARFRRLTRHLADIFPHITGVTTKIGNEGATAYVWSEPLDSEREYLAAPLADSGTGISHVLAILYVVVTSDTSKVIIIDEPQSFLHPGAARKLFEVLRHYAQHQYIVTTHTPPALMEDDCVFIARREGAETKIVPLDTGTQAAAAEFLLEVGARLSDVFGADSVLWVEGKTEETCFPVILRAIANRGLGGVQLLALIHTGDLNKKDAARVFDIYSSLSRGPTLMPQALAFVLDDDGKSDQEKRDLGARSGARLHWLPRRMFENYLLDAAAITEVMNAGAERSDLSAEAVEVWMAAHASDPKFWKHQARQTYRTDLWISLVHGAELLEALFDDMTNATLPYDKVRHGLALTRILCHRESADMISLSAFITGILDLPLELTTT